MNKLFPEYKPEEKKFLVLTASVVVPLSFLLQILLYYRGFFSISADESGRSLLAYKYLYGIEVEGEPWLPFHTIVNAFALKIYPDLFWSPRITGTIFGLFSTAVFIYYSHRIFQNRGITLFAAVIGTLFPPFVIIRAVPLSEIMFILFILSGSIFLLKWLQQEKKEYIFIASLFFCFSSSVRYEGWLFSLCFAAYLVLNYKKITPLISILNFILLLSFPLYWIILNFIQTGYPFYFIGSTSGGYLLHHKTFLMLLKYNLITQFIYQNILYLNFAAAASIIFLSFTNERIRIFTIFLFSAFIIMAVLSFAGIGMPSHAFWRIPLVWSILLIPFSSHILIKLSGYLADKFKKEKKFFLFGFAIIIVIYFCFQIVRLTGNSAFTPDERNTGKFINEQIIKEKSFKVLIDSSGWEYLNIYVSSNFPDIFIPNTGPDSSAPGKPLVDPNEELKLSLLNKHEIKYLVFESEKYKRFFDQCIELKAVKNFGKWKIYSLLN